MQYLVFRPIAFSEITLTPRPNTNYRGAFDCQVRRIPIGDASRRRISQTTVHAGPYTRRFENCVICWCRAKEAPPILHSDALFKLVEDRSGGETDTWRFGRSAPLCTAVAGFKIALTPPARPNGIINPNAVQARRGPIRVAMLRSRALFSCVGGRIGPLPPRAVSPIC